MGRPGPDGRFGEFGGRFVPESLMPACLELEKWFDDAWADPAFRAELDGLLRHYGGRPTPVTECARLSERLGVRVLLKREDLAHTGSHKLNNVVGQALLTKRMGKSRMIAETGAGQHGVASATAAALFGLECTVFMGEVDTKRQELNVFRMELLGRRGPAGDVGQPHAQGRGQRGHAGVGGDASTPRTTASARSWGRIPSPTWCASSSGWSARRRTAQCAGAAATARHPTSSWPASAAARTRRGRSPASSTRPARLVGVEAAGGAAVTNGIPGVLHGMHSRLLQDEAGQIQEAESISAGLDYPGLGPEHAHLAAIGRAEYSMAIGRRGARRVPAAEPHRGHHPGARVGARGGLGGHAAPAPTRCRRAPRCSITLSGRGDKDVAQVREIFGRERDA